MSDVEAGKVLEQIQRKREEDAEKEAKERRYQELKEINRREQEERETAEKARIASDKEEDRRRKKLEQVERDAEKVRSRQALEERYRKMDEAAESAIPEKERKRKPETKLEPIGMGTVKKALSRENIKGAVKKVVGKGASVAGSAASAGFTGIATQLVAKPKQTFRKSYTQETKDISSAARTIARPATPQKRKAKTYATPVVRSGGIAVNPAYVDNILLGTSSREPPAKKRVGSILSPLDRFSRLI